MLLVCDKKAAIIQVEERLSDCGLGPVLLNLHDEDLDKREFLRQATDKFSAERSAPAYPFAELKATRKVLSDRIAFGRATAHPSLQVARREAMAGLIQLRKELKSFPSIGISNWQSLSRERLAKLLASLAEWQDLKPVVTDQSNVWNDVRTEIFDNDPYAPNELQELIATIQMEIGSLDEVREWTASVGIEVPLVSATTVKEVLALVGAVLGRPECHPKLVGNREISLAELEHLKNRWEQVEQLVAARHPVRLSEVYPTEAESLAEELLEAEGATSWEELSGWGTYHEARLQELGHCGSQGPSCGHGSNVVVAFQSGTTLADSLVIRGDLAVPWATTDSLVPTGRRRR
jgi:hypothetical protein